jgi:hypothetical protein
MKNNLQLLSDFWVFSKGLLVFTAKGGRVDFSVGKKENKYFPLSFPSLLTL